MKHILTTLLLGIASMSFAQKDLGLPVRDVSPYPFYDVYIADDGTFVIKDRFSSSTFYYDAEGNKILEKKTTKQSLGYYDPAGKFWFNYILHEGKFTIVQRDMDGNVTKTLIKDKFITGHSTSPGIYENGVVNFYITAHLGNMLPLVVVKYNLVDKTYQVINYRDIPGITGKVAFIGERSNEAYFVNYTPMKTKKKGFDVKIYAVNDKKEVRLAGVIPFEDSLNY